MRLKFTLRGPQIKHIKGAIQSLGKIGSDLLVEAIPERLILRGINSSRSAYMSVTFHCGFFDSYGVFDTSVVQAGVLIKSVLTVFRSQRIKSLEVELKVADTAMTFTLECGNGLQKTFMVQCMDTEILQASVDKDQFPVTVVAETGEMNKLLSTFQSTLDEIIILCNPDNASGPGRPKPVQLQSFFDPAKGNTEKALRTQLAIDTHHVFLNYRNTLGEATDVTFNLKDFKCMVQLCEAMAANMVLRFDQPGLPLVVEPHLHAGAVEELQYEAELVLATLMESQAGQLQQDAARLATPGNAAAPIAHALQTPARGPYTPGGLSVPGDTPATRPGGLNSTAVAATATGFTPHASRFTPTQHARPSAHRAPATGGAMQWERPAAAQLPTPSPAGARPAAPPNNNPSAATATMPRGGHQYQQPQSFVTPMRAPPRPNGAGPSAHPAASWQHADDWRRRPSQQDNPVAAAEGNATAPGQSQPSSQGAGWEMSLAAPINGGACSLGPPVRDEAAATPRMAPAGDKWAGDEGVAMEMEEARWPEPSMAAGEAEDEDEDEDEDAIPSTPPEKRMRCGADEMFGGAGMSDGEDG